MGNNVKLTVACLAVLLGFATDLSAQNFGTGLDPKEEKEFYESISLQVDRLTETLDLNDAQVFYADSILTYDYTEMNKELQALTAKKVSNADLFYNVQYKWQDEIYDGFRKILNDEQWEKYLKSGAARDKKNRDKRREKSNK